MDDSELAGDPGQPLEPLGPATSGPVSGEEINSIFGREIPQLNKDELPPDFVDFLSEVGNVLDAEDPTQISLLTLVQVNVAVHGALLHAGWSVTTHSREGGHEYTLQAYKILSDEERQAVFAAGKVSEEQALNKHLCVKTDPQFGSLDHPGTLTHSLCQVFLSLLQDGMIKVSDLLEEEELSAVEQLTQEAQDQGFYDLDKQLDDINKYGSDEPEGRV